MKNDIITISNAARYLHVHINTLRNWIKNKKIKVIRTPGGHFRIPKYELIKLMKKYNFPISEDLVSNKYNIILIDDDEKILKLYKRFFTKFENYSLFTFSNGFDALLKIVDLNPQLILLDIFLPKMDGFEFAKKIKENNILKNIKIIAISNVKTIQEKVMLAGIDDFYFKGEDLSTLERKMKRLIGKGDKNEFRNRISSA
ncbi:MAG: response regulator [Spirochaetes bacterium]|nr:response regulator [Spirochaetota bacterium]